VDGMTIARTITRGESLRAFRDYAELDLGALVEREVHLMLIRVLEIVPGEA
jgi:hypothetical protein